MKKYLDSILKDCYCINKYSNCSGFKCRNKIRHTDSLRKDNVVLAKQNKNKAK